MFDWCLVRLKAQRHQTFHIMHTLLILLFFYFDHFAPWSELWCEILFISSSKDIWKWPLFFIVVNKCLKTFCWLAVSILTAILKWLCVCPSHWMFDYILLQILCRLALTSIRNKICNDIVTDADFVFLYLTSVLPFVTVRCIIRLYSM